MGRATLIKFGQQVHLLNKSPYSSRVFVMPLLQNNLRKTKSLNTNNQKCKKKQVQTNKRTLIL